MVEGLAPLLGMGLLYMAFERVRPLVLLYFKLKFEVPAKQRETEELPRDLAAIALEEEQGWAQSEIIKAMRETHAEVGDWDLVRRKFGSPPKVDE